jgi:hypothetical protein
MSSLLKIWATRTKAVTVAALVAASLGACSNFESPDLNAATTKDLTGTPTRVGIATAAQGLLGSVQGTNVGSRNMFSPTRSSWGFTGARLTTSMSATHRSSLRSTPRSEAARFRT